MTTFDIDGYPTGRAVLISVLLERGTGSITNGEEDAASVVVTCTMRMPERDARGRHKTSRAARHLTMKEAMVDSEALLGFVADKARKRAPLALAPDASIVDVIAAREAITGNDAHAWVELDVFEDTSPALIGSGGMSGRLKVPVHAHVAFLHELANAMDITIARISAGGIGAEVAQRVDLVREEERFRTVRSSSAVAMPAVSS